MLVDGNQHHHSCFCRDSCDVIIPVYISEEPYLWQSSLQPLVLSSSANRQRQNCLHVTWLYSPRCYFKKSFLVIGCSYRLKLIIKTMRIIQDTVSASDVSCVPIIQTKRAQIILQLTNKVVNSIKMTRAQLPFAWFDMKGHFRDFIQVPWKWAWKT